VLFSKPLYDNPLLYKAKKMTKEIYYKAVEKNRSILQLGHKKFVFEIKPLMMILKSSKDNKNKLNQSNFNNETLLREINEQPNADESEVVVNMEKNNELVDEPEQELPNLKTGEIKLVKKLESYFDIEDLHDNLDDFLKDLVYDNEDKECYTDEECFSDY
jgi:hypothetical protein